MGLGAPLLGDPVYGAGSVPGAGRTMLHAESLTVTRDGKPAIEARAPMPADFRALGATDG
jgi:tRNA pseudouridine32 synthase/23S rRNA pseudouridine746 synthase